MKKNIFSFLLAALTVVFVTSCKEENGTVEGSDPKPVATLYQYEESTNPDNNVILRIAANNKVKEAYYIAEKTDAYTANLKSMGEEGYKNYVVEKGTKLSDIKGASSQDITLTDLFGSYTIAIVTVGEGVKSLATDTFVGLDWADVTKGTYYFFESIAAKLGVESAETTLQVCTTNENLFRFKDLYGEGANLKFTKLPDYTGKDNSGVYTFIRVQPQTTPFTYKTFGAVGIRDIGYWQGDDSWVTDSGYEGGIYSDGSAFLMVQYYVSAGNLGYGYDEFVPAE